MDALGLRERLPKPRLRLLPQILTIVQLNPPTAMTDDLTLEDLLNESVPRSRKL